jgi:hypothetical protein
VGSTLVEWVLCVPVLAALVALLFGFLLLALEQLRLETLCARAAETLARSDETELSLLQEQAEHFVRAHSSAPIETRLDRHFIDEKIIAGPEVRPPVDVVGVELSRTSFYGANARLRAYVRVARVR